MEKSTIRNTKQRSELLRVLNETHGHLTAEWIHSEVKKTVPSVSLATIYRLLNLLVEEGKVNLLPCEDGCNRYDSAMEAHHHIFCSTCGHIEDVPNLISAEVRREIERWTGFEVKPARLDWHGVCAACRRAGVDSSVTHSDTVA